MQLIDIEKAQYRKRLNIVIVGFILGLLALSLLFGSILIALFSEPTMVSDALKTEAANNFRFNLSGVILALLACAAVLNKVKTTAFFNEIYYVWQLKQLNNLIYRKLKKLKTDMHQGNINALIIMNFYYKSLTQVYLLDDNTLTMSTLEKDIRSLDELIASKNLSISTDQFEPSMLKEY
ncbi:DUF3087 family protein [Colwelliaceae bacterium 6471]